MSHHLSVLARLCWALDRRPQVLDAANVVAAAFFVAGCVVFYAPALYVEGVTLFLIGSLIILAAGLANVLVKHGPSA